MSALSYNIPPTYYRIEVDEPRQGKRTFLVHREKVIRQGRLRRYPFLVWVNPNPPRPRRRYRSRTGNDAA
jgi:hypothetical protein